MRKNRGITLIALVITIIVLLILAGVSIATLLGENGILTKAADATEANKKAEAKEKVQLEVLASYDDNGKLDITKLQDNLEKNLKVTVQQGTDENGKTTLEFSFNGYDMTVDEKGNANIKGDTKPVEVPTTVKEAIASGHVYQENENSDIQDAYGNKVKVPAGFKVVEGEDVTKGVVIEDATYANTKGSQFVWIPVGTVYTDEAKTEENAKSIELNRYEFAQDGTETPHNQDSISDCQELRTSDKGNAVAKESVYDAFTVKQDGEKTKVEEAGGYYIGRYEARVESGTLDISDMQDKWRAPDANWTGYKVGTLVEKPNTQVFNYTTQNKASELCRHMYASTTFESDLMNSYAWDTAVVFLQAFDDRSPEAKKIPYSQQDSLNTEQVTNQGTNNLNDNTKQDKICNIWDMSSNCYEWTTETNNNYNNSCVCRGDNYNERNECTSTRQVFQNLVTAYDNSSFRPILIV